MITEECYKCNTEYELIKNKHKESSYVCNNCNIRLNYSYEFNYEFILFELLFDYNNYSMQMLCSRGERDLYFYTKDGRYILAGNYEITGPAKEIQIKSLKQYFNNEPISHLENLIFI